MPNPALRERAEWIVVQVQQLTSEGCYLESIADDVESQITEYVRELLAEDEAIQIMCSAFNDDLPGYAREARERCAKTMLAALRERAEPLHSKEKVMPKFIVTVQRIIEEHCEVTVTATDEDAAGTKAVDLVERNSSKQEWELEDESYEVYEVNEE